MSWNGSGLFVRLFNWVNDRDASIPITASRMDSEMDGMATGISACLTKNGENSPTANLPMGNFRHTGVGNAVARNDYAAAGQVQDGSLAYAADSGTANTYTITLAPAITAYAAGQVFQFKATNANTGASTLNANSVGAKNIKKNLNQDLDAGDIKANDVVIVLYDGTSFHLISSSSLDVDLLTDLQAIPTTGRVAGELRYMKGRASVGDGGEGMFEWDGSNLSTEVGDDEVTASQGDGGVYIAPSSDRTGASGAWVRVNAPYVDIRAYAPDWDGATDITDAVNTATHRNGTKSHRKLFFPPLTCRMSVFRATNVEIIADIGCTIELFDGGVTPVMVQINDDVKISNVDFSSTETDLDLQRATLENSDRVELYRCKFRGFRDVTGSTDAWGLYINNSRNWRIIECGFDDNSQSDIAIIEDNDNGLIDGCYSISDTLDINFEPNTSTKTNQGITLRGMTIHQLAFREPGSGGTVTRDVSVFDSLIRTLVYDGSKVSLNNCEVQAVDTETEPFFGELHLDSVFALGPNLLADPYLVNTALTSSQATTNDNDWFMNARTGSIGSDQLDPLEEDGVRFTRINPTSVSGTINFKPLNEITTVAGEAYLIAVTGRNFSGTSGAFMQLGDGGTNYNCRLFRQSNDNIKYWTTEYLLLPIDNTALAVRLGLWATSTDGVDIRAVSVHKIIGRGGGEKNVIDPIHTVMHGPRMLDRSGLPTMGDANVDGFQQGDMVKVNDITHVYGGSQTFLSIPISSGTTGGSGSAGAGNQFVEIEVNGTTYKVLHDGTV